MRRIHAIKPPNEIPMPPLRLVRLPAQPGHQPVRQPHVGRVANDSIDLLDLGDGIERGQGGAKRSIARPDVDTMYLSARKLGIRRGWL